MNNPPENTRSLLINTFMSLVTQQASEEVILDVLVGEAGLILPSLGREDLELVVLARPIHQERALRRSQG